jgi:2-polyprenyl-3-methyl-5-hydroxy-6-metoxy-1,4-benzoquinol methylase
MKLESVPSALSKASAYVLGAGYYVTVGQWFWRSSTLRQYQKQGRMAPCPVCGGEELELCCSIPLTNNLALFDSREEARSAYNLGFLPESWLKQRLKQQEGFATRLMKASIDYLRCRSCDVYFQNQAMTAEERSAFYKHFYRSGEKFGRPQIFKPGSRFHLWADHLTALTGAGNGRRFLDIGCAEGFLVLRMRELGFDAYGIEPSAPMVRFGQEDLGLANLKSGDYDSEAYPESYFDLINAYHVLEHVHDHHACLEAAVKHLKPGGHLVISVPCPELAVEQLRSGAPVATVRGVLTSGHHLLFSRAYLERSLASVGLEVLSHEVVQHQSDVLPGTKTSRSGEKWLGMNLLARKPG